MKKWEIVLYILILLLYIAANCYLMFFHEAWSDESQAWVIDRIRGIEWLYHLESVSNTLDYDVIKIGFIVLLIAVVNLLLFMFLSFDPDFRKNTEVQGWYIYVRSAFISGSRSSSGIYHIYRWR